MQVGWREWVALPKLGIPGIKAKVDTGARTSALHAFELESYEQDDALRVRFRIHPLQRRSDIVIDCDALVIDQRVVKDSGGHAEERFVIRTTLACADLEWPIEVTLTHREDMQFRMLLGRTALREGNVQVNPAASYVTGRHLKNVYTKRE